MPRFAANVTMLFTEVPMLARPDLAREAGFDGVEVLFPYDHPAKDWQAALTGMPLALINTHPGDWAAGDRGHAAVPGMAEAFRTSFLRAADLATQLGAGRVHVMAGVAKGEIAEATYRDNLAWAAEQAPDLTLTIEPLNPDDMPGYFLNDFDQAARIVDDLRNEPGGGGFDLTGLCSALDEEGWDGFVAAEYIPARATVHGLMWLQALKGRMKPIGG